MRNVWAATLGLANATLSASAAPPASADDASALIALEMADRIVLPVTPDMAALKTAVNTLRILKAVHIDDDKITIVLNEIIPRGGLTRQQVEVSLGKETVVIPHANAAFIEASNAGMPLVTVEPAFTREWPSGL